MHSESSNSGTSLVVVALVADVGLGVRAWDTWGGSEVLKGLSVLGSSKEEGVGTYYNILIRIEESEDISRPTSRSEENELVQSEALSTSFNDSGSCGFSESEGGDGQLRHLKESSVIGHCSNNNSDSVTI